VSDERRGLAERLAPGKVMTGDAREVLVRLDEGSVDFVFTSPPYADLRTPGVKPDGYAEWLTPIAELVRRALKPAGSFVLNMNDRVRRGWRSTYVFRLVAALEDRAGFRLVETYIWSKPNAMPGSYGKRPKDAFEYVFWFASSRDFHFDLSAVGRPYARPRPNGSPELEVRASGREMTPANVYRRGWADPGNVIELGVQSAPVGHHSVMPVELAEFFIKAGTRPGDLVLDPFAGSGTTLVAAEALGRRSLGIEIDPAAAAVAMKRLKAARRERRRSETKGGGGGGRQ
jgi:DNA modification methylase